MSRIVAERYKTERTIDRSPSAERLHGQDLVTGGDVEIDRLVLRDNDPLRAKVMTLAERLPELQGPGLVPIRAIHISDEDCYVVSDHVPGVRLSERVERGQLDLGEVQQLVVALAQVLGDMHARGLVHGHLSPHAVVMNDEGTILLRWIDATSLVGPARLYQAPEAGSLGLGSERGDVFALGALAYGQVTGLYGDHDVSDRHMIEALFRQCVEAGMPASDWRPDLPSAWDDFLHQATALDPGGRFASMSTLAAAAPPLPIDAGSVVPDPDPIPILKPAVRPVSAVGGDDAPTPRRSARRVAARGPVSVMAVSLAVAGTLLAGAFMRVGHAKPPTARYPAHLGLTGPRPAPPYVSPATVTFHWAPLPGATSYRVALSARAHGPDGNRVIHPLWQRDVRHPWLTVRLLGARTYLWRVAGINGTHIGPSTAGPMFLVDRPHLAAPTGLTAIPSVAGATFCWRPVRGADTYRLHVADETVYTGSLCASVHLPTGSYTWSISGVTHALRAYRGPAASATVTTTG